MRFDLLSLQLFVAVCEEQSIAKAADREHIAASAVSKRISDLEARLKVPLFLRNSKGLELTPAGVSLLQHARIVMRDLHQMESELGEHKEGLRGRVRIFASVSTIIQHLPQDLKAFLDRHPAIRIELREGTSQGAAEAVVENTADIGVLGGVVPLEGLRFIPYKVDTVVALVHREHPLSQQESINFDELADHQLIGPMRGSYLDSLVGRAASLIERSLKMPIRVNGFETVSSMVEAGLGIGIVPERCAERYVAQGNTVAIPLAEPWATRQWNLCIQSDQLLPTPVQSLVEHLTRN